MGGDHRLHLKRRGFEILVQVLPRMLPAHVYILRFSKCVGSARLHSFYT